MNFFSSLSPSKKTPKAKDKSESTFEVTETVNALLSNLSVAAKPVPTYEGELTYVKRSALFKLIEQRQWDEVISRAGTNPEECQVWHKKKDDHDPMKGGHPILPVHLAMISGVPKEAFQALLNAYPDCVKCKDDEGRLPLHIALENPSPDFSTVDSLITLYPDSCKVKDNKGRIAVSLYNDKAIQLFRYIEKKKWKDAMCQIQSNPEEAATWIFRREKDGKTRWRLTSLHAAIIYNGPLNVIEAIIDAYPDALKKKDDEGMLPVHLAFRNNMPNDVIYLLLDRYPEGLKEEDNFGKIPVKHSRTITSDRTDLLNYYANTVVRIEKDRVEKDIHSAYKDSLESKLRAMESSYEKKRRQMTDEYKKNMETAQTEYAKKHALAMKEVNRRHTSSIVEMNKMHALSLENVSKKHQESLKGVDAKYSGTIANVDGKITETIEKEKEEHEASLLSLKTLFDKTMVDSKKDHEESINIVKAEHHASIVELKGHFEESTAQEKEKHVAELSELQNSIDSQKMAHNAEITRLQETLKQNETQNEKWKTKVQELENTIEQLNAVINHRNTPDGIQMGRSGSCDRAGAEADSNGVLFYRDMLVEVSDQDAINKD